jgi:hypothetical protein
MSDELVSNRKTANQIAFVVSSLDRWMTEFNHSRASDFKVHIDQSSVRYNTQGRNLMRQVEQSND